MNLSFSEALVLLKQGKKITREGWNCDKYYLEHDIDLRSFIIKSTDSSYDVVWLGDYRDLVSNDWFEVTSCVKDNEKILIKVI